MQTVLKVQLNSVIDADGEAIHTVKYIHVLMESSSALRLWYKSVKLFGNAMVDSTVMVQM